MFFLEPFYRWLVEQFDGRINHFPLIHLLVFSLDHTLIFFLLWGMVWFFYLLWKKQQRRPIYWRWEIHRHAFIFYILLLFNLTVFRYENPFETLQFVAHPLSDIQWIPLVDSIKLFFGESLFSAYYNVVGNIVWFIPLGIFCGMMHGEKQGSQWALSIGLITSLVIELSQFIFMTGVAHVDDVLCNVLGSMVGYWLYQQYRKIKRSRI